MDVNMMTSPYNPDPSPDNVHLLVAVLLLAFCAYIVGNLYPVLA